MVDPGGGRVLVDLFKNTQCEDSLEIQSSGLKREFTWSVCSWIVPPSFGSSNGPLYKGSDWRSSISVWSMKRSRRCSLSGAGSVVKVTYLIGFSATYTKNGPST